MSRQSIIDTAASQEGITESPPNSNKTKYGIWYGLNGVKWCAIFVSWVYDHAGHHLEAIDTVNGYQSCQSGYVYWTRNGHIVKEPQPGDIVLYDWGGDGICDHTGIFVQWIDGGKTMFTAWEGNTEIGNNSDGGKVMLRNRARSLVRAFVTPRVLDATPNQQGDDLLQVGDSGSHVSDLQKMLFNLEFDIKVDGIFGAGTEDVVRQFQQKHGLTVTGIVTPELFGFIQEEESLPNVPDKKLTTGSYVRKGDGGNAVLLIQEALNTKGANPRIDENGVFDNSTLAAVKSFQQQNNLGVDGIVGPETFQQLGILNV
jgi:peptidoglycan hydrolase-like protein with peptidoglycan-binding domain